MKVLAYDIVWDLDKGDIALLPTEVLLEDVESVDTVADRLSDIYGWCIRELKTKVVSK